MTTFTGTSGNDVLPLTGDDNSGDDVLYGLAGNDTLYGGAGNDLLFGGVGGDTLMGGAGVDTASYEDSSEWPVNVNLGGGGYYGLGPAGERLFDIENVIGTRNNDTLTGDGAANTLAGGFGTDTLNGAGGNDTLIGGTWRDTLSGGSGADRFLFESVADSSPSARDEIRDFSRADGDKIDLSGIDANVNVAGDQAFEYSGASVFYGIAGQLHVANGEIEGDTNGDRVADFSIQETGLAYPINSDFIL